MKKIILISLIFFFQNGFSQECGGGKLFFNIYILNGMEIDEFEYEILPVSKELLQEKYYQKVVSKINLDNPNYYLFQKISEVGGIIMEQYANEIIETNNEKLNRELKEMLDLSNINPAPQGVLIKINILLKSCANVSRLCAIFFMFI